MMPLDFEQIYNAYYKKVMGYIMSRLQHRADAEDLCSEVFEKVYKKFGEYDGEKAAVGTWIYAITRNTLIDHYRKNKPSEELDENIADGSSVEEGILQTESLSELAAALGQLPQELRDIMVLRYYDGKPLTEIADMMGLSYGAIKLRHQKALNMLRMLMGG